MAWSKLEESIHGFADYADSFAFDLRNRRNLWILQAFLSNVVDTA